jgi:rhamnose transport system substrate-binding protein
LRKFNRQELILAILVAFEIAIFSVIGQNFFTLMNFFEILRLGAEIGLLSLALTPVIVTGGIDLSVGSMMGLCAVVVGALWHDAGVTLGVAVLAAVLIGLCGGLVNGVLIARLRVSPLIVTLATYSLFRGIAEGITGGFRNYTSFPASFLYLGQGYLWGVVPVQALVLALAAVSYWVLLQRSVVGRAWYAIGSSPEGARYAALPVTKRLVLAYVLSGLSASVAAVIYVAHLGQAKSDAGTGYELTAITAVVLGGTSILGGSGTIGGTLLGLAGIVVLQNGLRLAALPAELAGIATGCLLIATLVIERLAARTRTFVSEESTVKNSQVAILCSTILAGSLIVVAGNWYLVRGLRTASVASAPNAAEITMGMMPKAKGDPYFISCRQGAGEAAAELGIHLIWDGPTGLDAAKQNEVVEGWITRRVDAIAVSVENQGGISTVLRKARAAGIKVVTWDADAAPDARDYFINQATPEGIGTTLADEAGRLMGGKGDFAIVTGALSAVNQNLWIQFIQARVAAKYPGMRLVVIRPSDDDRDKAFAETQTILKVYPNVRMIIAIAAPAVPGAGEAVKQAGRRDITVIGLSLPSLCRTYIHDGWVREIVLWKTKDLGYLTVRVATALARHELPEGATSFAAGRLGTVEIKGRDVVLGVPFVFAKDNIDQFSF